MTQEQAIEIGKRVKSGEASKEETLELLKFLNQTIDDVMTFLENFKA